MLLKPGFLLVVAAAVVGCSGGESADTSPLPAQDTQSRVEHATQNVNSSTMSPEQKQAADAYLKQGATGAEQMRKSAQAQGSGGK